MALHGTNKGFYLLIFLVIWLSSCSSASIPDAYTEIEDYPTIYPDYIGGIVPCNIAPLNFMLLDNEHAQCVVRVSCQKKEIITRGKGKICFDLEDWHQLLGTALGDSLMVELFVQDEKQGRWTKFYPFYWKVADPIDRYVSYRLIPPAYMMYEELRLAQRDLTTFEQDDIYNNLNDEGRSPDHCINCHAFQNYCTDRMQFHVREGHSGTVFYDQGKVSKRNLNRRNTIGPGVYPSWHPTQNLIAYSTNRTIQHFHSVNTAKVEVQDTKSDLILYDVERDSVIIVADDPYQLEVFPSWSPEGKSLYYSAASVSDTALVHIVENYQHIHYNIYKRNFDDRSLSFYDEELVVDAATDSLSAILPRISPNGRWLLYSLAPYGVFHIWHRSSDLYILDLKTNESHPLTGANSNRAESYHNWSSNGKWIVFTSRRTDDNYSRLFFSYIDDNGMASKAFEMPQADPEFELIHGNSYNVPEFTIEKVKTNIDQLRKIVWK